MLMLLWDVATTGENILEDDERNDNKFTIGRMGHITQIMYFDILYA